MVWLRLGARMSAVNEANNKLSVHSQTMLPNRRPAAWQTVRLH